MVGANATSPTLKGTVVTVTHDRYFLENISEWILELDNGKGLPFEGSYAEWLAAKAVRRAESKRAADAASKAADKELEWLRSAKAGSKTKARLKSYDALVDAARTADDASVGAGAIWIPPGPVWARRLLWRRACARRSATASLPT